jgi:hypothetical protein
LIFERAKLIISYNKFRKEARRIGFAAKPLPHSEIEAHILLWLSASLRPSPERRGVLHSGCVDPIADPEMVS